MFRQKMDILAILGLKTSVIMQLFKKKRVDDATSFPIKNQDIMHMVSFSPDGVPLYTA